MRRGVLQTWDTLLLQHTLRLCMQYRASAHKQRQQTCRACLPTVGFAAATTNGSTVTASRDVAAAAAQAAAAQAAAAQAAAAQAAAAQAAAAQAAAAEASANRAATAQAAAAAQAGAAQATAARFKAAQQLLGSAAQDLQAAAGHLHKAAAHQGVETGLGLGRFRREALPVAGEKAGKDTCAKHKHSMSCLG